MRKFFFLAVLLLFPVLLSSGQVTGGTLRGKVADTARAVILGAGVSATGPDGKEHRAETDNSGEFRLNLPPGQYVVRVTLSLIHI